MFSRNGVIFLENFLGLIFVVKIVYIIHMSNFGLEKTFTLLCKKICIFSASSVFLCAVLGLFFVVCYAQNSSSSSENTSKYVNASFLENIKPQEYNMWFGIEDGMHYMKMQKSWREAFPISQNNIQDVSSSEASSGTPAHFSPRENSTQYETIVVSIDIIKFNPQAFDFSVYSASWEKGKSKTLGEWSGDKNLVSAINASMFLPDGITSNGYLRKGSLLNNERKGTRLGGFFVADPKKDSENSKEKDGISLPHAAIIYNNDPRLARLTSDENIDLGAIIDKYNVVVQNFKLLEIDDNLNNRKTFPHGMDSQSQASTHTTGKSKNTNWKSDRRHSIAAIAEDADGNILFLHSQTPLTIQNFIKAIKSDSSLNLRRALYTEGGRQASMSLTVDGIDKYWLGQNNFLRMFAGQDKLPNVIGVKRK